MTSGQKETLKTQRAIIGRKREGETDTDTQIEIKEK